MSLAQKLEQLRQKPQHVRERILMVLLAFFAAIIFLIWVATFHFNISGNDFSLFKKVGSSLSNIGSSFPSAPVSNGNTNMAPTIPAVSSTATDTGTTNEPQNTNSVK